MKLTPIEDTLRKIFKKRHEEYEQIAGGKIEPKEITAVLLAEGFAKEPVIRYQEHLHRVAINMEILRTRTLPGKKLKTGARVPGFQNSSLGIPTKATGGSW